MKRIDILLLLAFTSLSTTTTAQEVTVDAARNHVLQFLSANVSGPMRAKGQPVSSDLKLAFTSKVEAKTCFYVFNVGDDEGFVIAGGDESARQILGYSDHGTFDYDQAPDNFRWWLDQYTEQILHAEAPSDEALAATAAHRAKAASSRPTIDQLLTTEWNQNAPYNSEIPVYDNYGDPYVTGCVATAMAQIMNYHRCPATKGSGSLEYVYNDHTFYANFGATTYDWANMLSTYDNGYTDAQAKAVGTLMYHAGVSVRMQYSTYGSGAASSDGGSALACHFGYDKSVRYEGRDYFTDEAWEEMVYNELAAHGPVLYSGSTPHNSGHAFVCDAYDASLDMFHFNWGWGGRNNCYCVLTGDGAVQPSGYSANSSYTKGQEILLNVMKDNGGEATPHFVVPSFFKNPVFMTVNGDTCNYFLYDVSTGALSAKYKFWFMNSSCVFNNRSYFPVSPYVKTKIGIKAYCPETGVAQYFGNNVYTLVKDAGLDSPSSQTVTIDLSKFEYNGTYQLLPAFCINGTDDWQDIQVPLFETIPTVTITGAQNSIPGNVHFTLSGQEMMVGKTVKFIYDSNYQGTITYTSSNPDVATVDPQGVVKGISVGNAVITARAAADPERQYLATEASFEVQVVPISQAVLQFTLDPLNVDVGKSIQIIWSDDYDGVPTFTSSDPAIATVDAQGKITGVSGGDVEIKAHVPETPYYFESDTTFNFKSVVVKMTLVEEPHFGNDNNVCDGYFTLGLQVRNDCGVVHDVGAKAVLVMESGYFSQTVSNTNVNPGSVRTLVYGFNYVLNSVQPKVNKQYTTYLYDLNGELLNYPSVTFTYRNKLTVDYTVGSVGYGTLILPFYASLPKGMTVYSCPEVDDNGVLTLVKESTIKRNVPYIVEATPGDYTFTGPEAIDADKPSFQEGILVGAVTSNVPLQKGTDYILQEQNGRVAFFKYTGTKSQEASENDASGNRLARQFRAFLRLPNASSAPMLNLPGFSDDEATGIREINLSNSSFLTDSSTPHIYTPDGYRHSSFQKGLNILILDDGTPQKVFVK